MKIKIIHAGPAGGGGSYGPGKGGTNPGGPRAKTLPEVVVKAHRNKQQPNKRFWRDNWQDVAFLTNDAAQALANGSSVSIASRYNLPKTTVQLPLGLTARASTKVVKAVSKVGKPIAKAAPWVAYGVVGYNVVTNNQITAGDIYQITVTSLSLFPGAGLIVGGSALLLEGISYLATGQGVSDNINQYYNGGVIINKVW